MVYITALRFQDDPEKSNFLSCLVTEIWNRSILFGKIPRGYKSRICKIWTEIFDICLVKISHKNHKFIISQAYNITQAYIKHSKMWSWALITVSLLSIQTYFSVLDTRDVGKLEHSIYLSIIINILIVEGWNPTDVNLGIRT